VTADSDVERRLAEARWQAVSEIGRRIAAADPLEETLLAISTWQRALLGRGSPFLAATAAEREAIGVRPSGFFLFTADRRQLQLYAGIDFPPEQVGMRMAADFGLPGIVVRTVEPLVVTNTDEDPRFEQIINVGRAGSTCQAPIVVEGRCEGMSFVASMAKNVFWPEDVTTLTAFAALASAAIRAAGGYRP
jgi:GAF domain-containing protein